MVFELQADKGEVVRQRYTKKESKTKKEETKDRAQAIRYF
jgi:hypothetical protein